MKTKLIVLSCAAMSHCYSATNVGIVNFTGNVSGVPIVDNAGVPIDSGNLLLWTGTFDSAFIANIGNLNIDTDDQVVLDAFTPSGTAVAANPAPFPGLFNTSVSDADNGNALLGQDVYLVIQDTSAAAAQLMVIDLNVAFPQQDATGAAAIPGTVLTPDQVIFGSTGWVTDTTSLEALNAGFATGFEEGISFDSIPEPSTSLLAALAGLGLIARRRR
jgi:hypothetical protein